MWFFLFLAAATGLIAGSFGAWRRFGFDILKQKFHVYTLMVAVLGSFSMLALLAGIPIPVSSARFFLGHTSVVIPLFALTFSLFFVPTINFFSWLLSPRPAA